MTWLQSGKGRMMIDSVVWAQYINVTDTQTTTAFVLLLAAITDAQTDKQTDRITDDTSRLHMPPSPMG